MADQVMRELEASAEILLAPPNVINSEQRHCAESVFLNFQKTKSPFHLCQYILGNSKSDYVQFQAASLLKQAVIREWKLMGKAEIEQLRAGLMHFVVQNINLKNYVREQLLLVVAIMVKRCSVEEGFGTVADFLTEVSQLISSGDSSLQTIGCSIVTALLNEFSSSTRASDVGLTWESHLIAKKKFEKTDLKRLFQFCLQGLSELNKIGTPIPSETAKLFKKFLIIAEQVLTWNFQFAMLLPRKLVGMFESQQCPALRPSIEWHEVFLDPNVVQLFFKLHWQVRDNPDLCHHTLQCFHQLASLNGNIMSKKEDRCAYLRWYMENLLQLLTSGPLKDYEGVGISNMISRLHVFFPAIYITSLPTDIVQAYLIELTNMTCRFSESAIREDVHQDDKAYMEAHEHMLEAWVTILQDNQYFPQEIIRQSAIQIFNHYLKAHLSQPDGIRPMHIGVRDEIDEIEEDDRSRYRDQLSAIGMFARQVIDHSVPILVRLLEDRITRLHGQLQRIHQQAGTADDTSILEMLNEDIHWLVMITGHMLSSLSEGETTLIPADVISYSLSQANSVNIETTLQVLASPSLRVSDIPGAEQSTDPVVRVIAAVFRLCEVEKRALEANLTHLLSPEVGLTLVWFIGRFSITYLLPNESYYNELSLTLTQAFGKDSEAGLWTLNFVIGKLEANLSLWVSEPKLVTESAQTLTLVLNNTERGDKAINCESLIRLVKKQSSGHYQTLPTAAKRSLLKSLVIVGTANKQTEMKEGYFNELLKPLQEKFRAVMCCSGQSFQSKPVQLEVMDVVECLIGVVDGCTLSNLPHLLPVVNPLFEEVVKLADVYHNYSDMVGMVIQVFCTAAKKILCYLNQVDSKILYECCVNLIRIYAKHNVGKLSGEASAEEEQYQDILVLMQLLTDLLFKDFIDFSPPGIPEPENTENACAAADVVLYGLSIIMPLMNTELLKFPSLCLQYFKLVTLVCEIHPDKIFQIPEDLLKSLLTSIQLGLTSFTPEISSLCLDFLSITGIHLHRAGLQHTHMHQSLEPFLKIVLDMLLQQPLDADLTQIASSTLYTLICLFQSKYKELVQELINGQNDPATAQRLLASFNNLTANMTLSLDRYSRMKFRDDFEKFITEVRGYLCVK